MADIFIHPTSFIDQPCEIGKGVYIWHFCHLMPYCIIGENCVLGQNVFIGSNVILGNNVRIQNNVSVYDGVICESDVFIGPSVVFTNVINPRSAINRKNEFKKTIIKKGATIGANTTIVCGNIVGKFAFVGAGSVVTKNVSDYALVFGNPARQKGWVSEQGMQLLFESNTAICPANGDVYTLENGVVKKL